MFKGRVVFIGGDGRLSELTAYILEKRDFDVYLVTLPRQLQTLVEKQRPHLIIVDQQQKAGLDGLTICRALRQRFTAEEMPVLYLTRESDPSSLLEGVDAGANEVMAVPYKAHELLAKTTLMIRRRRQTSNRRLARKVLLRALAGEVVDFSGGVPFGDYVLEGMLGRGSMGGVFRARHARHGGDFALKVLDPEVQSDGRALQRLEREGRILMSLDHPHIVGVHDVGSCEGFHFLTMDYVRGQSLMHAVEGTRGLALDKSVRLLEQLCGALAALWETGLIHRDVKPENILICPAVGAKLVDFGLARGDTDKRLTRTGVVYGTPNYMSPEQIQGLDLDFRTDMYSLGATAYYLLTGAPPFDGPSTRRILFRHVFEDVLPLDELCTSIPPALSAVVCRMMAKEPQDRYPTAQEMIDAVGAVAGEAQLPINGGVAMIDECETMADCG